MSKTHTEIESRGPLSAEEWGKLMAHMCSHGKLLHDCDELTLYIESPLQYDTTTNDKSHLLSASVKLTKDRSMHKSSLIYREKTGSIDQTLREESSRPHFFNQIAEIIPYLQSKGIIHVCPRYFHRVDFALHPFVISMKESGYIEDHFEIEVVDTASHMEEKAQDLIQQFVNEHHIRLYGAAEHLALLTETYRRYPPIPIESCEIHDLIARYE